jgi:RHS repeat-associated protein
MLGFSTVQYNGRVFDPGTGFHDYGARMYWPQIGRFISPDTNPGHIGDPQSLNRYAYVLNNPYKYVDPTGRESKVVIVHSRVLGMDVGYHAAVRVDNGGGGEPVLFDPGGSYQPTKDEPRGSSGNFQGKDASLAKYVKWQRDDGDNPVVYRFSTTAEEEKIIASRFGYSPDASKDASKDPGAGSCASAVSGAVSGVGPFKKIKQVLLPGSLEDQLKKAGPGSGDGARTLGQPTKEKQ